MLTTLFTPLSKSCTFTGFLLDGCFMGAAMHTRLTRAEKSPLDNLPPSIACGQHCFITCLRSGVNAHARERMRRGRSVTHAFKIPGAARASVHQTPCHAGQLSLRSSRRSCLHQAALPRTRRKFPRAVRHLPADAPSNPLCCGPFELPR